MPTFCSSEIFQVWSLGARSRTSSPSSLGEFTLGMPTSYLQLPLIYYAGDYEPALKEGHVLIFQAKSVSSCRQGLGPWLLRLVERSILSHRIQGSLINGGNSNGNQLSAFLCCCTAGFERESRKVGETPRADWKRGK